MLTAGIGERIFPSYSGQLSNCPVCSAEVIGRCGKIVIAHWAHRSGVDCDRWSEPMTEWHSEFQRWLKKKGADIEVIIKKPEGTHRADARLKNGRVIEIQHSYLSVEDINERESFYGDMVWVFNARAAVIDGRLDVRHRPERGLRYCTFRWIHPRKTIAHAKRPVYLDTGIGLLHLKKIYPDAPCGGFGHLLSYSSLLPC